MIEFASNEFDSAFFKLSSFLNCIDFDFKINFDSLEKLSVSAFTRKKLQFAKVKNIKTKLKET